MFKVSIAKRRKVIIARRLNTEHLDALDFILLAGQTVSCLLQCARMDLLFTPPSLRIEVANKPSLSVGPLKAAITNRFTFAFRHRFSPFLSLQLRRTELPFFVFVSLQLRRTGLRFHFLAHDESSACVRCLRIAVNTQMMLSSWHKRPSYIRHIDEGGSHLGQAEAAPETPHRKLCGQSRSNM